MDQLVDRLLRHAHLFDDPDAYEAGVLDALEALESDPARQRADSMRVHPAAGHRRSLHAVRDSVA